MATTGSPASSEAETWSGESRKDRLLGGRRRSVDDPTVRGRPESSRQRRIRSARVAAGRRGHLGGEQAGDDAVLVGRPDRASRRRNEAPALSSPPKPMLPSIAHRQNHLKPTGTSRRRRPRRGDDAVDHPDRDERLADGDVLAPLRPPPNRCPTDTDRKWLGLSSPAAGVTMPWRSASASLPKARSKRSRNPTRRAIACGDDGSIRIRPSQSQVMNANCGSTDSFVTVRSRP